MSALSSEDYLENGEWVTRRGVLVWVQTPQPELVAVPDEAGPPPRGFTLTLDEMRTAHAAHQRGGRDPETRAGEREYQRWSKRRQRARQ